MDTTGETQHDTPLARLLKVQLKDGPMPVQDYVAACLHHPEHGYYRNATAIGRTGDFVTAPEISQVFGELIGLWAAVSWQAMGSPQTINLVEIGPGRGTMMKDALRAIRILPEFRSALHVHLIEANPTLCDTQWETLAKEKETVPITWHKDIDACLGANGSLSDAPVILLANEYLDTLPIEQYVVNDSNWFGRTIALEKDQFVFLPTTSPHCPDIPPTLEGTERPGDVFETCTGLKRFVDNVLVARAEKNQFAALLIDYGHVQSGFGDSLQAVKDHKPVSVFHAPGESDITAQVDFASFKHHCLQAQGSAAPELTVDGPVTQAEFLGQLGIVERAAKLMNRNPEAAGRIEAGIARLMAPIGMGGRFKVCAVRSANLPPLISTPMVKKR